MLNKKRSLAYNLTFSMALIPVVLFGLVILNLLINSLPALVDPGLPGLFGIRIDRQEPLPVYVEGIENSEGKKAILSAGNIQFSEDDNVLVRGVANNPYAIGYFGYAYYQEYSEELRTISIDGISPNFETAESGDYPLSRPLFIYSDASIMEQRPQVAAFINYFLTHVNENIEEVGYFPAGEEALAITRQAWLDANFLESPQDATEVSLPELDPMDYDGDIIIAGSSTVFPLAEIMVERFREEGYPGSVTIDSIGTGAGFERFCRAGETDIANASRAIRSDEIGACETIGRTPIEFRVGTDAIAIVVSNENTFLQDVSKDQLAGIFATAEKWSDVDPNWPDEPIQRFSPGTDSGTFDYFVEAVMAKAFPYIDPVASARKTVFVFNVLPPIIGTLQMMLLTLLIAFPVSLAIAIMASEFSLGGLGQFFEVLLALFSGIPPVIYGIFTLVISVLFIQPKLAGRLLSEQFIMAMSGLPAGHPDVVLPRNSSTTLIAGILLSMLVIPYMSPLILDAIRNVPKSLKEASMGLGATRWYTLRRVVLPGALSGIIAAVSLGLLKVSGDVIIMIFIGGSSATIPNPIWDVMETNSPLTAFAADLLGELVFGSASGVKGNVSYFVGMLLLLIAFAVLWLASWLQRVLQRRFSA